MQIRLNLELRCYQVNLVENWQLRYEGMTPTCRSPGSAINQQSAIENRQLHHPP
jgi:hypothetical protein